MPESDLANGGIYVSGNEIFKYMDVVAQVGDDVQDLGHHILPRLTGKMYGFPIAPYYLRDIGTPEAYKEALTQWPVAVEPQS